MGVGLSVCLLLDLLCLSVARYHLLLQLPTQLCVKLLRKVGIQQQSSPVHIPLSSDHTDVFNGGINYDINISTANIRMSYKMLFTYCSDASLQLLTRRCRNTHMCTEHTEYSN